MGRRKALLIGINYFGSQHQLQGCIDDVGNMAEFLASRGYSNHPANMVVLTDANRPDTPYWPSGHNILAAMNWLVSEPGCMCFLHYSGHGGQVPDPDGDRSSGFDDTIVPVDFERNGQISSNTLHRHLVSALPPNSTLFIIFDCCHRLDPSPRKDRSGTNSSSGSAVELPFVYRTDEDGNVNIMDNLRMGAQLIGEVGLQCSSAEYSIALIVLPRPHISFKETLHSTTQARRGSCSRELRTFSGGSSINSEVIMKRVSTRWTTLRKIGAKRVNLSSCFQGAKTSKPRPMPLSMDDMSVSRHPN